MPLVTLPYGEEESGINKWREFRLTREVKSFKDEKGECRPYHFQLYGGVDTPLHPFCNTPLV